MWIARFTLEFWVELYPDEPRMVCNFNDLGEASVGAHAGKTEPHAFELVAVADVDFVAMAVALRDGGGAIDFGNPAAFLKDGVVGA